MYIFILLLITAALLYAAAFAPDKFYDDTYYSAVDTLTRVKNFKPTEVVSTVEGDTVIVYGEE